MGTDQSNPVAVSRRIDAPAGQIFRVLESWRIQRDTLKSMVPGCCERLFPVPSSPA